MEKRNAILWIPRAAGDVDPPIKRYGENNSRFISIRTLHGGFFIRRGGLVVRYTGDNSNFFDFVDPADLCFNFLERMFNSVGFHGRPFFFYQHPEENMDYGMIRLETPADFARFKCTVWPKRWRQTPTIFAESNHPSIKVSYPLTLLDATKEKMVELLQPCMSENPDTEAEGAQDFLLKKFRIKFPLPMIEAVKDEAMVSVWEKRSEVWCLGS